MAKIIFRPVCPDFHQSHAATTVHRVPRMLIGSCPFRCPGPGRPGKGGGGGEADEDGREKAGET
jgi:hypothetical protein